MRNVSAGRILLVSTLLLLIPLAGMLFSEEVAWDGTDFIVAWVLFCATGFAYKFVTKRAGSTLYRMATATSVLTGLLLIWVNLAVGLIGNENNPANLMYFGVITVGLIGASLSRLRAKGMARALLATAVAQLLVPLIAMMTWRPTFGLGVVQVLGVNAFFAVLWGVSALLFQRAGEKESLRLGAQKLY